VEYPLDLPRKAEQFKTKLPSPRENIAQRPRKPDICPPLLQIIAKSQTAYGFRTELFRRECVMGIPASHSCAISWLANVFGQSST
jgi:hypothetical protein